MYSERCWDEEALAAMVAALQERGLIVSVPDQPGAFTRAPHGQDEVQVVRSVPRGAAGQPTIAVVTSLYCEKLAVDAMLSDTETYVRYNTVGTFYVDHKYKILKLIFNRNKSIQI